MRAFASEAAKPLSHSGVAQFLIQIFFSVGNQRTLAYRTDRV
jgi:hypothetical protein